MNDLQRVLHYVVSYEPTRERPLVPPFQIPGLSFDTQIAPALRRLATARPPFVEAFMLLGDEYPHEITGVTERGWEETDAAPPEPPAAGPRGLNGRSRY